MLTFVGCKLVSLDLVHIPAVLSLSVVLGVLGISVVVSWWRSLHT